VLSVGGSGTDLYVDLRTTEQFEFGSLTCSQLLQFGDDVFGNLEMRGRAEGAQGEDRQGHGL